MTKTHYALVLVGILAALAYVGTLDAREAQQQCERTREMVALWESSGNEYGWPPEQMHGCEK